MRNKFSDMNNHLFAQLERLSEENLQGKKLEGEIQRGKAIASLCGQVINAAKVTIQARKMIKAGMMEVTDLPLMIEEKK